MEIEFKVTTDDGPVEFYGKLNAEEVETLCTYALVHMIRQGILPLGGHAGHLVMPPLDDDGEVTKQ